MPTEGPDDEEDNQKWKHSLFSTQHDIIWDIMIACLDSFHKKAKKAILELSVQFF